MPQRGLFIIPHIKLTVLYLLCYSRRFHGCSEIKVASPEAWRPLRQTQSFWFVLTCSLVRLWPPRGAPMCQSSFGFGFWATLHFVVRCDAWHCMYYGCSRTGLAAASARALSISVLLSIALSKVSLVPLCLEEYRNVGFTHKLCPCLLGAPYVPSKEMILYQKFR